MANVNRVFERTYRVKSDVTAITYDADGNYSSGGIPAGTAVKLDATEAPETVTIAAQGNLIVGISTTSPAAGPGQPVSVLFLGIARCKAGAATTAADKLYVLDSSGRVGTAPALGQTSQYIVGQGLQAATQADDFIEVLL